MRLLEFADEERLLRALAALRDAPEVRAEVYGPAPLPAADRLLGRRGSRIAPAVLVAGLGGAGLGYLVQWWCNAVAYPLNVGAFPPHAPPSFIPIAFETGILCGGIAAFVGVLVACRLPRPWHPLDEVPGFERATVDRWFLALEGAGAAGAAERAGGEALRVVAVEDRP